MTSLSHSDVVREATRSRAIIGERLRRPIRSIAYPFGDADKVTEHLIAACGYYYGLSVAPCRRAHDTDSLLSLPRIEVTCDDGLESCIAKLGIA